MVFRLGWLSTGRDEAARDLLMIVVKEISKGILPARICFVFCNRDRGESPESDRFIQLVEELGIPLLLFSSRDFLPSLRENDVESWRIAFHEELTNRIIGYPVDTVVLAGYMLIMSPLFCETHPMINLHPAEPKGPKGTWQEVIWQLMEKRATRTGAMMHVVTKDLDEGPPITFFNFPIQGPGFDPLWKDFDEKLKHRSFQELVKEEGEENPLFKEIRRQGVRRELPLIVLTLKVLAEGRVRMETGRVLDASGKEIDAIGLNEEVEEYLRLSKI